MNKIIIFFLLVIFSVGCQISTYDKNSHETETDLPEVEEAVIVFDEAKGEASIAKNFYFLFDGSGSMNDDCANERKIDGAKTAIYKFLEKVPDDINLGLLVFGTETEYGITELLPLGSNNKEEFRNAISSIEPNAGTPLGNATRWGVQKLLEQYKMQLGYGEYRLIVVTDGIASDPEDFREALNFSREYPFVAIYGIGLCIQGNHMLKSYSLKYTDAYNYEELGKALEETLAESQDFDPTEFSQEDVLEVENE